MRAWDKALKLARQLEMPYEVARIQFEVGRLYDDDAAASIELLEQACEGFDEIDAGYDLSRAQAELERLENPRSDAAG